MNNGTGMKDIQEGDSQFAKYFKYLLLGVLNT